MSTAEIRAKIAAYRDALDILRQHAQTCAEAANLEMDVTETIQRRVSDLYAKAAELDAEKRQQSKQGRGNG